MLVEPRVVVRASASVFHVAQVACVNISKMNLNLCVQTKDILIRLRHISRDYNMFVQQDIST